MTRPEDVQAAFCAVLCDEWARAGVTDAVVAPGSRSTPMVAALDAEARIRVHVVLDERSAGFMALGLAMATGRPAVVVTTSGTASVELHPAVVEASQAHVPLLAVTTDRPPELHHVGAPQTVEQAGLFAGAPRWELDPGVADGAAAGSWRSLASRGIAEAMAPPGPVHLNLPFREPLLGDPSAVDAPPGRPDGGPWHRAVPAPPGPPPAAVVELLRSYVGRRGLIVAGPGAGDPEAVVELGRRLGWPVLADPRSGARLPDPMVVGAADALLRAPPVAGWRPDIVLRLGTPWASKVLGQWLAGLPEDVPQVLADRWGRWADPDRTASHVVTADAGSLLAALPPGGPVPAGEWTEAWSRAEAAAQEAMASLLADKVSEPAVARACLAALPDDGALLVSSSMPVRDVEWYGAPRRGGAVLSNRGANGIDGVISTAMGVALAGRPTIGLLGDLAFLYDAGALLWAGQRPVSLTLVVLDNDGGGIFSFLPQAQALAPERFERYWGTPHGLDLVKVAAAYGVDAERISDVGAALRRVGEAGVRVFVVPSDRGVNVAVHDRIHAAVADAVRAGPGRPGEPGA